MERLANNWAVERGNDKMKGKNMGNVADRMKAFNDVSERSFTPTAEIPYPRLTILPGETVTVKIAEPVPFRFKSITKQGESDMMRLVVEYKKQLFVLLFAAKPTNTLYRGFRAILERHTNAENLLEGIEVEISRVKFTHDEAGDTTKYEVKEKQ